MSKTPRQIVGERFGLLVAVEKLHRDPSLGQLFLCRCDCGSTRQVPHSNLLTGNTRSCGCLKRARSDIPFAGASRLREFQIWKHMNARCTDARREDFANYGGRGIAVCDRWRHSFANFLADMGRRPSSAHTLDRRDVNGPYSPDNCQWSTWTAQQRNRRTNRLVEYRGETLTLIEWSERTGIPYATLGYRIRKGWPLDRAMTP